MQQKYTQTNNDGDVNFKTQITREFQIEALLEQIASEIASDIKSFEERSKQTQ